MVSPENPDAKLRKVCRHILEVTSEDFYAEGQSRVSRELAQEPQVMEQMTDITAAIHRRLQDVLWSLLVKIGPSLNVEQIREDALTAEVAADMIRNNWNRFRKTLDCLRPDDIENQAKYIRSYNDILGREPFNAVERLLRDTMIYAHRLAQQLLDVLGDDSQELEDQA